MKKALKFTVASILLILFSGGLTFILLTEHYTGRLPWEDPETDGAIHTTLNSEILNEDREIIIRLPLNYDSTQRYPVMYVLDGGSEDQHIADKLEVLSSVGHVPPTIVVGVPNMTAHNRQLNLTPPFMHMDADDTTSQFGGADQFLSFLEKELLPYIDDNYATSSERLISGNSRGGLLVMYSLITKPDLFTARFCYSTPLWRQNDILISKVAEFMNTRDTLKSFMYISAGADETDNIKSGLGRLTKVLEQKIPVCFSWDANYTTNADHHNNARISAAIGVARWGEYLKAKGRNFESSIVRPVVEKD